jgi:hypothetical protein
MEPEGSLPHSQEPTTCPNSEPDQPRPCSPSHFLKIHFKTHLCLDLPGGLFPSGFLTKTLYTTLLSPVRATCPANLILLDLITQIIFGEQYRSLISPLCSFLHSPVTSSLSGPNILHNPYSQKYTNILSITAVRILCYFPF